MRYLYCFLFLSILCTSARAQRVLLFERMTQSKSERLYEGDVLEFRLRDDKFWQQGRIREMRPDIQAMIINDRYVMLDEIEAVRWRRPLPTQVGAGLITFGVGWSFFALVGYSIDGDSGTSYGRTDALVSATSVGLGYTIMKLFGTRKFRPGKYRRLRVVDLTF